MQAVLCMDAGGIEATNDTQAPTLETHLRGLVRFEEQKAGVEGVVGPERGDPASQDFKPFFKAVEEDDLSALEQLLQKKPELVSAINREGLTALDMAVSRKCRGAERFLRANGGVPSASLADAGKVMDAARNVGAFNVRVMRRKGLARGTERALRTLIKAENWSQRRNGGCRSNGTWRGRCSGGSGAESAVAGAACLVTRSRRRNSGGCSKRVFSDAKDVVKKVPARCLRIPRDSFAPNFGGGGAFLAGGDKSHRSPASTVAARTRPAQQDCRRGKE